MVKYIEDKSKPGYNLGAFLVAALFFRSFFENFLFNHQLDLLNTVGMRMRTSLINLIYKKSLRLSSVSRRTATVGEIVNLMQVNTQTFFDLMSNSSLLVSVPFQLLLSVLLLWYYLGKSVIASMVTIGLLIPFVFVLAFFMMRTEQSKLILKDSRIKLTNEILNGMKVYFESTFTINFKEKNLKCLF